MVNRLIPEIRQKLSQVKIPAVLLKPFQGEHPLHKHPKFWLWLGMGVGMSSSAIAFGWLTYSLEGGLPRTVDNILNYAPEGTITIKGSDGVVIQEIGPVTHEKLKIWQIPEVVLQAFIASEDRRFEEHKGVDLQGIARAAFSNLQAGEVREGGSTITQQLARIVFLNQERSFGRKFKEMRLAQKIEQNFDKNQIMERYLNLVYLGSGAYGIGDAAWVYFSKPADELTLAEAATLAGIVPAPSVYSPLENPEKAKERRDIVLKRMEEQGLITTEEADEAIAADLETKPSQPKRLERKAPYFTDYIQQQLPKYVSSDTLKKGGITVETTLNTRWQEAADDAIETAIKSYGRWQNFKQAALVAIDPRNGQIKAMIGGNDFEKNQFNRVTQAKRQPGSTFKPFVYATAIAAGFSPYRSFLDAQYVVDGYKPENYGDHYSGGYVSMSNALASSLNVVAVQILVDVGWNPIIKVAHKMGIESELQPTYSLALGASEVNLLELTSAYGTFANQGIPQKPYGINRILDSKGKVLYQAKFKPEPEALDQESTAIMTWMLQGVVDSGTGTPAQIGRPVAGKTGTSDKARDLWFVGYIPQLVAGVWLGNDDNQPTWGASSTSAATWRQFMLPVVKGMTIESFPSRPRNLEGRKGTLKAEPIKPKRRYYNRPKPTDNSTQVNHTNESESRVNRRKRRYRSITSQQEQATSTTPQVAPQKTVAPKEVTAEPAVSNQASQAPPPAVPIPVIPAPEPAPAPPVPEPVAAPAAAEVAPLAPPAARKE